MAGKPRGSAGVQTVRFLLLLLPSLVFGQYEVDPMTGALHDPATMTALNLGDDGSRLVSIGFDFVYFDQTFNEVWVSSNGFLSFSSDAHLCCNGGILSNAPRNSIYALWTDLTGGSNPYVISSETSFTAGWYDTLEYGSNAQQNFEITLNHGGSFNILFGSVTEMQSHVATIGFTGAGPDDNYLIYRGSNTGSFAFTGYSITNGLPVLPAQADPAFGFTFDPVQESVAEEAANDSVVEEVQETAAQEVQETAAQEVSATETESTESREGELSLSQLLALPQLVVAQAEDDQLDTDQTFVLSRASTSATEDQTLSGLAQVAQRSINSQAGAEIPNTALAGQFPQSELSGESAEVFGVYSSADGFSESLAQMMLFNPEFASPGIGVMSQTDAINFMNRAVRVTERDTAESSIAEGQSDLIEAMNSPMPYQNITIPPSEFYLPRQIYSRSLSDNQLGLYMMLRGSNTQFEKLIGLQYE